MPYVHAVFCDDLRYEIGNKVTFVGTYGTELYVAEFPILIPKLCVVIYAITDRANPFPSISLQVSREDLVLIESPDILSKSLSDPDENTMVVGHFVIAPLQLERETKLRVAAVVGENTFYGPSIRICRPPKGSEGTANVG